MSDTRTMNPKKLRSLSRARAVVLVAVLSACGTRSTNLAWNERDEPDARPLDASATDAGGAPDRPDPIFRFDDAGVVMCGTRACACSDGLDNDGDDAFDGLDPECTGAFDDFEDSFATGSHGEDQTGKRQDCFYDGNSGSGDDGCNRERCCASGEPGCGDCAVEPRCSATCAPLAPNGCDCFGCCGVWKDGGITNVLLGAPGCTIESLADPSLCPRCTAAPGCANPCGPCELCPGRTVRDLPATCASYTCDESATCQGATDCPGLATCQQGCCLATGI